MLFSYANCIYVLACNFHRPAEYILLKLKQKGKVREKDEAPIVEKFQTLDVDKTGKLSLRKKMS